MLTLLCFREHPPGAYTSSPVTLRCRTWSQVIWVFLGFQLRVKLSMHVKSVLRIKFFRLQMPLLQQKTEWNPLFIGLNITGFENPFRNIFNATVAWKKIIPPCGRGWFIHCTEPCTTCTLLHCFNSSATCLQPILLNVHCIANQSVQSSSFPQGQRLQTFQCVKQYGLEPFSPRIRYSPFIH